MKLTTTALSSTDLLTRYIQSIKKYPILSADEEYILARSVVDHQDIKAAHKLVTSHLKLVVKIALTMRGYGLSLMDLISEGNIGLMHAVKKFNPELGHRLSTYAMWWIKVAIQEYIIRSWSLVKVGTTAAQKKLFFNLNKIKKRINNLHASHNNLLTESDIDFVAEQLNVSPQEVKEMESRLAGNDYSLDTLLYDDEGRSSTMLEYIPERRADQETILAHSQETAIRKKSLYQAMLLLNERERDIISARHLQDEPETLNALSKRHKISLERVRQIESSALAKLKIYI
jgi:RNA polymerase sigma-32 factor